MNSSCASVHHAGTILMDKETVDKVNDTKKRGKDLEICMHAKLNVDHGGDVKEGSESDSLVPLKLGKVFNLPSDYGATNVRNHDQPAAKKSLIVSAVANLSTAYNLAIVNYALMMIQEKYPSSSQNLNSLVVSCSLIGAILGQLTFGYIGDVFGRRKGMIFTLLLTIAGALSSAFLPWRYDSIYTTLAVCRFVLGLGVGGVYPLSATTAAESTENEEKNSKIVAAVFSFQGCGQLLAPMITYALQCTNIDHEIVWRILLGIGAVPGLFVLHHAFESQESASFRASISKGRMSLAKALRDSVIRDRLFGAAMGWFLFDITFYGNVIFTPIILEDTYAFDRTHLADVARYSLLVAAVALPGYYITVFAVDRIDFKTIQLQGFLVMSVLFLTLGCFYSSLLDSKALLLCLYALTFFFSNFGPNVSTFCLPAQIFPPDVRVQLAGISAASGKVGATIGAAVFGVIEKDFGVAYVLVLSGIVSLLGAAVTILYIPSIRFSGRSDGQSIVNA